MPPRVGPRAGHVTGSQQCLRTSRASISQREFSQSTSQQFHATCKNDTRLRRHMFAWLNGPGRAFREPLPGSTNYLGAYDKFGNLMRATSPRDNTDNLNKEAEQAAEEEDPNMSAEEKQQRKEARKAEAEEEAAQGRLPKESAGDLRPFPLNKAFRSESVLSEQFKDEIYKKFVEEKLDIATVSAAFGVDMRRVAAVVRLKTIENQWIAEGKKLATPYAEAVMGMLPQTKFDRKRLGDPTKNFTHESINDLPVHPHTRQQLFYPTSESRQFTRADAAKVFSSTLLPADDRIPLSELIEVERDGVKGLSREERTANIQARAQKKAKAKEDKARRQADWEAHNVKVVGNQRWNFRFESINVENAGKNGRGSKGVGWRYGDPHHDRKRGAIKLPTSVE